MTTTDTATTLPAQLKELWGQVRRCLWTFDVSIVEIETTQAAMFPGEEDYLYPVRFELNSDKELKKAVRSIFARLIREAERRFAPTGDARLDLPSEELAERWVNPVIEKKKWSQFDPVEIWAALETEYSGAGGHALAYRQAAEGIKRLFFWKKDREWVERAAGVVIDHGVYVETAFNGNRRLSTYSQRDVMEGLRHFKTFLEWANESQMAARLQQFIDRQVWGVDAVVTSRAKYVLGESMGVTTFFNRFEYVLSSPLAEQLQIFLGTYLPPANQAA